MIQTSAKDETVTFTVRVVPRASKSEIVGELNGALKVRLAAAPVDGAANGELIQLLAKTFNVSRGSVEIISGSTSKIKQIKVTGAAAHQLNQLLEPTNSTQTK